MNIRFTITALAVSLTIATGVNAETMPERVMRAVDESSTGKYVQSMDKYDGVDRLEFSNSTGGGFVVTFYLDEGGIVQMIDHNRDGVYDATLGQTGTLKRFLGQTLHKEMFFAAIFRTHAALLNEAAE